MTYNTFAHGALVALLGREQVVLSEGLSGLINASIVRAELG